MPFQFVAQGPMALPSVGAYSGPGDVVAFAHWYGLRAYNAAYAAAGGPAIDVYDATTQTNGPHTINVKTDGTLDVASITALSLAGGPVVSKCYDQTAAASHITNATSTQWPALSLSPVGLVGTGAAFALNCGSGTWGASIAQPYLIAAVAQRTGTANGAVCRGLANDIRFTFRAAGTIGIYAGTGFITQTETDNAFHSLQGVYNGASSKVNVDGTDGSAGDAGSLALTDFGVMYDSDPAYLNGYWCESGVIAATSASNSTLTTNMRSFWGF